MNRRTRYVACCAWMALTGLVLLPQPLAKAALPPDCPEDWCINWAVGDPLVATMESGDTMTAQPANPAGSGTWDAEQWAMHLQITTDPIDPLDRVRQHVLVYDEQTEECSIESVSEANAFGGPVETAWAFFEDGETTGPRPDLTRPGIYKLEATFYNPPPTASQGECEDYWFEDTPVTEYYTLTVTGCPTEFDTGDGDGICDDADNCPTDPNPGQENADGDEMGDVCDPCPNDEFNDADGDGVCGDVDNCPDAGVQNQNPGQEDVDEDGVGDVCDNCPAPGSQNQNPGQEDADGDAIGDICDACPNDADNDADQDGFCADLDDCPFTPDPAQGDPCSSSSSVTYILALGGDNHGGSGTFVPGDPADGQTATIGDVLTWEIRALVAGQHDDPGGPGDDAAVIGAALLLGDLELRVGTVDGPLAGVGAGSATTGGWFSGALPGRWMAPCRVFDLDGDGQALAWLVDLVTSGGPGLSLYQEETVYDDGSGATTAQGILAGVGAAMPAFDPSEQAAGVGLHEAIAPNCQAFGAKPLCEGQLNTTGLAPGTYVLKVVPTAGNILLGEGHCQSGSPAPIVLPANTLHGDTITFELQSQP